MALIEKEKFIEKYIGSLKRLLERELPNDITFESEMIENAEEIITRRISHPQRSNGTIGDL